MGALHAAAQFVSAATVGLTIGLAADGWFAYRAGFLTRGQVAGRLPAIAIAIVCAAVGWA
jgi:hypothetical protein